MTLTGNRPDLMIIDDFGMPPKLLSDEYMRKFGEQFAKDIMTKSNVWWKSALYHKGDLVRIDPEKIYYMAQDGVREVSRNLQPAEYHWSEVSAGIGVSPTEMGRTQISAEQALELGLDVRTLKRVGPDSHFYYKPQKEYPVTKVKKTKEVQYNTIGVRFLDGANLAKVYTYRIPKKARVHLGQEVIVPTDKSGIGYITQSVAVVVRIDKERQDNEGYAYKVVTGTIKPL